MRAERAFSAGLNRGNVKLRLLSAQSFAQSAIRVSAPSERSVSFPLSPPRSLLELSRRATPAIAFGSLESRSLMSTLGAIREDFLSEVRHDLLEPFASVQMGSVFPSSCLKPKSGRQARNGFPGSILRFEDGSVWVCPLNDSVFPPRPRERLA